jgi:transposase
MAGVKVKTDKSDAQMIALFAERVRCKYEQCKLSEEAEKLRALVRRRRDLTNIISIEKKRLRHPKQIYCREEIEELIAFTGKQVSMLDEKIMEMIDNDPDWKKKAEIVKSLPGIGKQTAAVLIADMPELGKLNNREAAALVGVAPYVNESGTYKGAAHISGGRFGLRNSIYMAALTASRYNPELAKFYKRLRKAGKKPKVAIVAVMRKMVTMVNSMIKDNRKWQVS